MNLQGVIYAPNSEVKFKNANVEAGDYEDEEDFETDTDEGLEADGGISSRSSIGTSFISRRLSVREGLSRADQRRKHQCEAAPAGLVE